MTKSEFLSVASVGDRVKFKYDGDLITGELAGVSDKIAYIGTDGLYELKHITSLSVIAVRRATESTKIHTTTFIITGRNMDALLDVVEQLSEAASNIEGSEMVDRNEIVVRTKKGKVSIIIE